MRSLLLIFHFALLSQSLVLGQGSSGTRANVDSIIRSLQIKSILDTFELADNITSQFATDSEKVRAIYFWMTQNISYDFKSFRAGTPVRFEGDVENYCDNRVIRTLSVKKGVCEDYALLFACLCRRAGIPCAIVTGFALLSKPSKMVEVFSKYTSDHAWNAVMLDKKWYLLDVTWASGYGNFGMTKFTKKLNDYYYLTPPEDFIFEHFPDEPKWQLFRDPLDWKAFINNARYRERDQ